MTNNLPADNEDDAPVKIAYHKAPDADEPEEQEDQASDSEKQPVNEPAEPEINEDEDAEETKDKPVKEDPEEESEPELTEPVKPPVSTPDIYYLQAVKAGEQPEWPQLKEDLNVYSQPIDGLMQYWAYPKDSGKTESDVPNAELVAKSHKSGNPVIIIDQVKDHLTPGCCLELVLAKNGHALARTDSNLDNLEANITSLLDIGKSNFGITAEHFISTSNVSPEVEKRLDDLEDAGGEREDSEPAVGSGSFQQTSVYNEDTPLLPSDRPILSPKGDRSKLAVFIPVLLLIIIGGLVVFYRDNLLSIVNPAKQEAEITPVPTQAPTPTPTPSIDRSKYKVRVLNGTSKTGAAGVLADKLKEKGWLIERTGNATSSAIVQSYVLGKVDLTEVMEFLIADVADYEASASSVILKPSDKADLEFVIGKK